MGSARTARARAESRSRWWPSASPPPARQRAWVHGPTSGSLNHVAQTVGISIWSAPNRRRVAVAASS
eukprot:10623636-Lingulodinium_polyedra.AAC.1